MKKRWKRTIIRGMIGVLTLFVSYNALWAANFLSYGKYIEADASRFEVRHAYLGSDMETYYTVKRPDYLSFAGNLAVANDGGSIMILAWPSFCCREVKDYGLRILDTESGHGFLFYVDENMNYLRSNNMSLTAEQEAQRLLQSKKNDVLELFELMQDEFGLNSESFSYGDEQ